MRQLNLHVSALNDDEFSLYTTSLTDLAMADDDLRDGGTPVHNDIYYEKLQVGVREARAWLRGRFSHVPVTDIDSILKLFYPNLGISDCLSGGQFFAALRLVVHAESGKGVDRALAFVQAHPEHVPTSRPPSPPKRFHADLPPPPVRRTITATPILLPGLSNDASKNTSTAPSTSQPPPQRIVNPVTNPFRAKSPARDTSSKLPPLPPRKPPPAVPFSSATTQPGSGVGLPPRHATLFLPAAPNANGSASVPISAVSAPTGANSLLPPLPTKTAHVTSTLMRQSLQASKVAQTMKKAEEQLEKERVLQVLKSSSTSGNSNGNSGVSARSVSPSKYSASSGSDERAPPLPRRRIPNPSPPVSSSSLEQVAGAKLTATHSFQALGHNTYAGSPFRSAQDAPTTDPTDNASLPPSRSASPRRSSDLSPIPPPTHPDRKPMPPSTSPRSDFDMVYGEHDDVPSPTSRVFRSKSMHYTSPPPVPPPLRRRRPESVQLSPSNSAGGVGSPEVETRVKLGRHMSMGGAQSRRDSSASNYTGSTHSNPSSGASTHLHESVIGMGSIQRTIATLQPKLEALQPKLDKARYKAEAGLSRRGFVSHGRSGGKWREEGEEGLMGDYGGRDGDPINSADTKEDVDWGEGDGDGDDEEERDGGRVRRGTIGRVGSWDAAGHVDAGMDNLKWPQEEGWKPL